MIETKNIAGSYRDYRLKEVEANHKPISRDEYKKILSGFLAFIAKKLVQGYRVKLGPKDSLGCLEVIGKKTMAVDWIKTNTLWREKPELRDIEKIYYNNAHSDDIMYKIKWLRREVRVPNITLYHFYPSKTLRRALLKGIKEDGHEYYVK